MRKKNSEISRWDETMEGDKLKLTGTKKVQGILHKPNLTKTKV
jgi:hypothetical protein